MGPRGIQKRWGLDEVAGQRGCLIVYVKAKWRNWGGWRARKPNWKDMGRFELLMEKLEGEFGYLPSLHLVGHSDGASFALYCASYYGDAVSSVTAYSGLYQKGAETTGSYPILLLWNAKEKIIKWGHIQQTHDIYRNRGHDVRIETFPGRHRWLPEANFHVSNHILASM